MVHEGKQRMNAALATEKQLGKTIERHLPATAARDRVHRL